MCTAHEFNSLLHIEAPLILVPPLFSIIFAILHKKTLPFHDERNCLRLANNHENKASNLIANVPLQKSHWPCSPQYGNLKIFLMPRFYVKSISAITRSCLHSKVANFTKELIEKWQNIHTVIAQWGK